MKWLRLFNGKHWCCKVSYKSSSMSKIPKKTTKEITLRISEDTPYKTIRRGTIIRAIYVDLSPFRREGGCQQTVMQSLMGFCFRERWKRWEIFKSSIEEVVSWMDLKLHPVSTISIRISFSIKVTLLFKYLSLCSIQIFQTICKTATIKTCWTILLQFPTQLLIRGNQSEQSRFWSIPTPSQFHTF